MSAREVIDGVRSILFIKCGTFVTLLYLKFVEKKIIVFYTLNL